MIWGVPENTIMVIVRVPILGVPHDRFGTLRPKISELLPVLDRGRIPAKLNCQVLEPLKKPHRKPLDPKPQSLKLT